MTRRKQNITHFKNVCKEIKFLNRRIHPTSMSLWSLTFLSAPISQAGWLSACRGRCGVPFVAHSLREDCTRTCVFMMSIQGQGWYRSIGSSRQTLIFRSLVWDNKKDSRVRQGKKQKNKKTKAVLKANRSCLQLSSVMRGNEQGSGKQNNRRTVF